MSDQADSVNTTPPGALDPLSVLRERLASLELWASELLEQRDGLRDAAQAVCLRVDDAQRTMLRAMLPGDPELEQALARLAMLAGCTNVSWWVPVRDREWPERPKV